MGRKKDMSTKEDTRPYTPDELDLLPERELSELHAAEIAELRDNHPEVDRLRKPFGAPGYWALNALHMADWKRRIDPRLLAEKEVERAEKAAIKAQIAAEAAAKSIIPKRVLKEREAAAIEAAKSAPVKRAPGRPVGTTKPKVAGAKKICRGCHKPIEPSGGRGRPSVWHDACRPV
jgi:hypothetical protein